MNESKHMPNMKLKDRVYRVKNAQLINDIDELSYDDYKRIEKYKEHVQLERKKDGKYILVFEHLILQRDGGKCLTGQKILLNY